VVCAVKSGAVSPMVRAIWVLLVSLDLKLYKADPS
jgi:hypothetical protein